MIGPGDRSRYAREYRQIEGCNDWTEIEVAAVRECLPRGRQVELV